MAFATYADLQDAVQNWLDNTDLAPRVDEFISLAEADIRSKQDWFERTYSVDENSGNPLTITAQGQELPIDVREVTAIWPLESINKQAFDMISAVGWRQLAQGNGDATGNSRRLYISYDMTRTRGPVLNFWPAPADDMDVDFTFIKDLPPLNTTVTELYLRNPDLYLYGALLQTAPYLQHDERVAVWKDFYTNAVARVNAELQRSKNTGSPKRVTLPKGQVF